MSILVFVGMALTCASFGGRERHEYGRDQPEEPRFTRSSIGRTVSASPRCRWPCMTGPWH